MNETDFKAATVQARLTYILVLSFILLMFAMLGLAYFAHHDPNDKMLALLGPLVTGLYGLATAAAGFWLARHRPGGPTDPTDSFSPPNSPGDFNARTQPSQTAVPSDTAGPPRS